MDDTRLRALLDELTPADAAASDGDAALLRLHQHDPDDESATYLVGTRAGLVRLARACLESALSPNPPRYDETGRVHRPPTAAVQVDALFDQLSDVHVQAVTCEEPLARYDPSATPPPPRGLFARAAPGLALLGCLAFFACAVLGAVTFVSWAAR